MFKIKNISETIIKVMLFALVSMVFFTTTVAFGNVIIGLIISSVYVYEISKL